MRELFVISAHHLPKMDLSGKADPYVEVYYGHTHCQTKVKKRTLDPEWHENYLVRHEKVTLIVKDHDRGSADDMIGICTVDMVNIAKDQEIALKLTDEDGSRVVGKDGQESEIWIKVVDLQSTSPAPVATTTTSTTKSTRARKSRSRKSPTKATGRTPIPIPAPIVRRRAPAHRNAPLPAIPKAPWAAPPKPAESPAEYSYEYYSSDSDSGAKTPASASSSGASRAAPPPPPPPARKTAPPVRRQPARGGGGRGGLLDAIRNSGGASGAGLRHVKPEKTSAASAPAPAANANPLFAAVAARRQAMGTMSQNDSQGFVQDWG